MKPMKSASSCCAPPRPAGDAVVMTLLVTTAERRIFEGKVAKVVATGAGGSRGFLPRHADFVMPLTRSIMSCTDEGGVSTFFAVDGGVLVKKGHEVTVVTRQAVKAERMEDLPQGVLASFAQADEHATVADRAANRLETMLLREFLELNR